MSLQDYAAPPQGPPTLDEVVKRVHEISTLPHIALQVIEVANDPKSNAIDMKALIETDPALSARLLRYANSSACARRERISICSRRLRCLG